MMSSGCRPKLAATCWTLSATGRSRSITVARPRPDRDRAHVHVRQAQERPFGRDREHRHRADASAGDDAAALDRVEREIDAIAAGADLAARQEHFAGTGADHDLPVDRQLVERRLHPARRGLLGRLLVGAAEPAGTCERRPLGRPRVPGAETVGHQARL